MAQGLLKKSSSKTAKPSASSKSAGVTKKGRGTITPKKAKLVKQAKINKKFTAGLTAKTEAMLGARAGHLEMLGQGRKKNAGTEQSKSSGKKTGNKS
ncbi:hypothetical protein PV08_10847 [Exophiala spinifera]|uniref:Uncharacterized protein n=1 Tax=Exophiala spinifera TaxID=91928 RepID=A0A0D1Y9A7_9EURO|nr:uncharacterized protein PV08_10847 [Exophiala spinifera]KIW11546.1 hypothetical protein PV08_10847 [Exophiala spinifera]